MGMDAEGDATEKECFAIMPIGDVDGYPQGHFKHVYENIIIPACALAGYQAIRADDVKASNLIHLDILRKLIDAPVTVCDLSTRNPNVLFELGIRQAFDKPVVLIQEKGTPRIFDIAPMRYLEYSKEMRYHEVLKSQQELGEAIEATVAAGSDSGNVNSIVKLLALDSPARIPELNDGKEALALELLQAEMRELRSIVESSLQDNRRYPRRDSLAAIEYERISNVLDKLSSNRRISTEEKLHQLHQLMQDAELNLQQARSESEHRYFGKLCERIHRSVSMIGERSFGLSR